MTPDELKLLQETVKKLNDFLDVYYRTNFIDKTVFNNQVFFRNTIYLPAKVAFFGSTTPIAKQAAISGPSGGTTVDSQARTAINSIISTLQALGLTS